MMSTARLQLGGLGCAACAVQIETALRTLPGLGGVRIDPATAEARVEFDGESTGLDRILREIRRLGYSATLSGTEAAAVARRGESRLALKRLAVAGFGMMQTMMFAFVLYASEDFAIDPAIVGFMRYVSLVVAVPTVAYAGAPIVAAALTQLRNRSPAMDVPVSLGIGAAMIASVWNTFAGTGAVYFEAATMFVFFLTVSRYVEMMSRHRVGTVTEALAWLLPAHALRLTAGKTVPVAVSELRAGDEILVNRGDAVAADGVVLEGVSSFDESCLSGESVPVRRAAGDPVISGSINVGDSVRVRLTAVGDATELAGVVRLLERSRNAKPRLLGVADRAARFFSLALCIVAGVVGAAWLAIRPEVALANTVAVLVVACPCALSLAAPSVMAFAHGALARCGLLAVSAGALEQLSRIRCMVVDKTGTLTGGRPETRVAWLRTGESHSEALALAAALERNSSHPLARAFRMHELPALRAENIVETPGQGLEGDVGARRLRIGRPDFVAGLSARAKPAEIADDFPDTGEVVLGDTRGVLARFQLADTIRTDVGDALRAIRARGITIEIASGDAPDRVARIAGATGIDRWHARMSPGDKVTRLRELRADGPVLMVGDGVNDAPVIAEADVSIAMRGGSALTQTAGDLLLLDGAWGGVPRALAIAVKARKILRQNLAWAMAYNFAAIPLAASGSLSPWVAALGMSMSSMLVLLNARRVSL